MSWNEFEVLRLTLRLLATRLAAVRDARGGMTTEAVILTAVLAALAIAATTIITAKVIARANSITLE